MQITLVSQVGAARGYRAEGEVLHGPGWSADFSALSDGHVPFSQVMGMASPARRRAGVVSFQLVIDGPEMVWDTEQVAAVGAGAPGGAFVGISPITLEMELAEWRGSAVITREAFAERAAAAGFITMQEAEQWGAGLSLPAVAQNFVDGIPDSSTRDQIRLTLLLTRTVSRASSEVAGLSAGMGLTAAQVDALFQQS